MIYFFLFINYFSFYFLLMLLLILKFISHQFDDIIYFMVNFIFEIIYIFSSINLYLFLKFLSINISYTRWYCTLLKFTNLNFFFYKIKIFILNFFFCKYFLHIIAHPRFNLDFIFLSEFTSSHPKINTQKIIMTVKNSNIFMIKLYFFYEYG